MKLQSRTCILSRVKSSVLVAIPFFFLGLRPVPGETHLRAAEVRDLHRPLPGRASLPESPISELPDNRRRRMSRRASCFHPARMFPA